VRYAIYKGPDPGPDATMSHGPKRIEAVLETLFDSVSLAEDISVRVAESAGFDQDDRLRISMAVREGVINAFRYGNQERRERKIRLILEREPGKLVVRILDQGPGFNLADVPDPLLEENLLKTSGRGIFLMRTFMDEFEVRCSAGGAELIMAKRLPPCRTPVPARGLK
jgi:serine/threonine-protein kinase RsbW